MAEKWETKVEPGSIGSDCANGPLVELAEADAKLAEAKAAWMEMHERMVADHKEYEAKLAAAESTSETRRIGWETALNTIAELEADVKWMRAGLAPGQVGWAFFNHPEYGRLKLAIIRYEEPSGDGKGGCVVPPNIVGDDVGKAPALETPEGLCVCGHPRGDHRDGYCYRFGCDCYCFRERSPAAASGSGGKVPEMGVSPVCPVTSIPGATAPAGSSSRMTESSTSPPAETAGDLKKSKVM